MEIIHQYLVNILTESVGSAGSIKIKSHIFYLFELSNYFSDEFFQAGR